MGEVIDLRKVKEEEVSEPVRESLKLAQGYAVFLLPAEDYDGD